MRCPVIFSGECPADGAGKAEGGASHHWREDGPIEPVHFAGEGWHEVDRRVHDQRLHRRLGQRLDWRVENEVGEGAAAVVRAKFCAEIRNQLFVFGLDRVLDRLLAGS